MARGLGINVDGAFAFTFALGSGLAGLGGALAIEIVGLDPSFAFTYLVYVLIVVSVGGLGSIGGSFAAATPARHQRRGRQVLRARARRVPDLSGHGRAADVAAGRPVREALMSMPSPPSPRRTPICRRRRAGSRIEIVFWLATLLPFVAVPELSRAREPDRHHGAVRALARSHPRLCGHRVARPRGVLRASAPTRPG